LHDGRFKPSRPSLIDRISKYKGATTDEIMAVLVKAFPDREADGMRKTVLIQGVDQTPFDGAACDSTVSHPTSHFHR
jgi:hypothetical protein